MASLVAVDTPDYQRGVVNPQLLLANVAAGTASVTVQIPPNAETLIVTAADMADGGTIFVQGTGSLYKYTGVRLPSQPHMTAAVSWYFDISQAVDDEVLVQFTDAPGTGWFVYADSGTHLVGDASSLKNTLGQAYVIASIPSGTAADHPPTEMQKAALIFNSTTNTTVLAAPGAGLRIRLFNISMFAAGNWAYVNDNTGVAITGVSNGGTCNWQSHPQGLPLATNSVLAIGGAGAAGTTGIITVQYTVEAV
jgi:hypothetical protein